VLTILMAQSSCVDCVGVTSATMRSGPSTIPKEKNGPKRWPRGLQSASQSCYRLYARRQGNVHRQRLRLALRQMAHGLCTPCLRRRWSTLQSQHLARPPATILQWCAPPGRSNLLQHGRPRKVRGDEPPDFLAVAVPLADMFACRAARVAPEHLLQLQKPSGDIPNNSG